MAKKKDTVSSHSGVMFAMAAPTAAPVVVVERTLAERLAERSAIISAQSKLPLLKVVEEVRNRFIPITQAHRILCLNEQYARRKVLDQGIPDVDYFEVFGRYLVDVEFLLRLKREMMS